MTAKNAQPAMLSIAGAAAEYGVSTKTIRRRVADGTITGYRFGPRLIRVRADELEALLRPVPNALLGR